MSREQKDTKEYVSILSSDGTFRLSVPEGTEGAVKREWSVDDKSGIKNELVFKALKGKVSAVRIVDADFGSLLQIDITDEEGTLTISTGVSNNFGSDLMKRLPNLDPEKEYRFAPYSFENDDGKSIKGVNITEDGDKDKKVENFFFDGKKNINEFPEPKGDTKKYTKNKWKSYFMEVEDFLVDYTKENTSKKFSSNDEINTDDIEI